MEQHRGKWSPRNAGMIIAVFLLISSGSLLVESSSVRERTQGTALSSATGGQLYIGPGGDAVTFICHHGVIFVNNLIVCNNQVVTKVFASSGATQNLGGRYTGGVAWGRFNGWSSSGDAFVGCKVCVSTSFTYYHNVTGSYLSGHVVLNTQLSNVSLGANTYPVASAYDPLNEDLYVGDWKLGSGIDSSSVDVINTRTQTLVTSIPTGVGLNHSGMAFDPSNGYLYMTNSGYGISGNNSVTVINGATNQVVGNIGVGHYPLGIAYCSANGYLYVADKDGWGLTVINGATDRVVGTIPINQGQPAGLTYDGTNGDLYVTSYYMGQVDRIQVSTGTVVGTPIGVGSYPMGITYDPSNGYLYVANEYDSFVSIINGATNSVVGSPTLSGSIHIAIAYDSVTGNVFVTGNQYTYEIHGLSVTETLRTTYAVEYGVAIDGRGFAYVSYPTVTLQPGAVVVPGAVAIVGG